MQHHPHLTAHMHESIDLLVMACEAFDSAGAHREGVGVHDRLVPERLGRIDARYQHPPVIGVRAQRLKHPPVDLRVVAMRIYLPPPLCGRWT